tara:strand:- start:493 stop:882 length:390 start_codon:yes stop_codon:yes gene_type:complete
MNSELIIFNIETNSFENDNKHTHTAFAHDVIIINNKIWSLSTNDGSLKKISAHGSSEYNLVDPTKYFLRGLVNNGNIIYVFATLRRDVRDNEELKSLIITFRIAEEELDIRELDTSIKTIYQAIIYSPN